MTESIETSLVGSGRVPSAEVLAERVRRFGWWYQTEWRLASMRAYWSSILGSAVLTPLLYVIATGIGLGRLVDANTGGVDGVSYLTFVAPGLLVSTVVMSTANELMFPVMAGFKWRKLYFARAATAASPRQVAIGELLAVGLRATAEAAAFWVVLVCLGATTVGWSLLMVPLAAVAGLAFGAPLAAYASTLENEGFEFSMIQRFVLMPMFLFAGTFYPLETMPAALQWIGWISPMWHGTQVARLVAFGLPIPAWQVVGHVGFLVVLVAAGSWLTIGHFTERLTR